MTANRISWRMVRFNAIEGGPAYVDLAEVAAILDAPAPAAELAVARGAVLSLKSGRTVFVKETADTVFEEVHRYRTELEPSAPAKKLADAAPAS